MNSVLNSPLSIPYCFYSRCIWIGQFNTWTSGWDVDLLMLDRLGSKTHSTGWWLKKTINSNMLFSPNFYHLTFLFTFSNLHYHTYSMLTPCCFVVIFLRNIKSLNKNGSILLYFLLLFVAYWAIEGILTTSWHSSKLALILIHNFIMFMFSKGTSISRGWRLIKYLVLSLLQLLSLISSFCSIEHIQSISKLFVFIYFMTSYLGRKEIKLLVYLSDRVYFLFELSQILNCI